MRELRRRRGVTLTTLSRTTGIPISILSRLESGQRKTGSGSPASPGPGLPARRPASGSVRREERTKQ
ncbi:helix-turn-helix domain-containing protein [Streptomyces parvulus]|uniref:helix-turn-helix domain-containing protein n=1 Tax=Streptomyces parvulus TaxID=146923 RepID=UPI0037DA472D